MVMSHTQYEEYELDFGIKLKHKAHVCFLQWYKKPNKQNNEKKQNKKKLLLPKMSHVPCFVGVH